MWPWYPGQLALKGLPELTKPNPTPFAPFPLPQEQDAIHGVQTCVPPSLTPLTRLPPASVMRGNTWGTDISATTTMSLPLGHCSQSPYCGGAGTTEVGHAQLFRSLCCQAAHRGLTEGNPSCCFCCADIGTVSRGVTSCVMAIMGSASAKDSCSISFAAFGCVLRSAPSTMICVHNIPCLAVIKIAASQQTTSVLQHSMPLVLTSMTTGHGSRVSRLTWEMRWANGMQIICAYPSMPFY